MICKSGEVGERPTLRRPQGLPRSNGSMVSANPTLPTYAVLPYSVGLKTIRCLLKREDTLADVPHPDFPSLGIQI